MEENILVKIEQGLANFTPSEKKIAKFILDDPENIIEFSITDLAQSTNTSEASVVRLCKKLGLGGYKDLKVNILWEMSAANKNKQVIYDNISEEDTSEDILDKVSADSIKAIEDTKKVLDIEKLETAVKKINTADNIYIFGVGSSAIVGMDLQYKLMKVELPAFTFLDKDMQVASSINLTKDDVAIAISNTGKTKDIITALKVAKKKGATTIAITQYNDTPILEVTDIPLYTAHVDNIFKSGGMASRIAQLNLIDTLFMEIASKKYDQVIENIEEIKNIIEDVDIII
ncbi:MurR/RpiR family transcriptional regulator [Halanaerocella petrolearia]